MLDDTRDYNDMIGKPVDDNFIQSLRESGILFRVVRPDTIITMDYRMGRLNIRVNEENIITGFKYG